MPLDQEHAPSEVPLVVDPSDTGKPLHPSTQQRVRAARLGLSLDWWAVIIGLILAGLILTGLLPPVKW